MICDHNCLVLPIFLVVVVLGLPVHGEKYKPSKPSYFPTCYRNDPQINQCLLNATEQVRPFLKKGIPEIRLPTIDPFSIPKLELEQGTRAMNFKAVLHNVIIHGLTNYKFSRFDFDVPNYQFFCNATIPGLSLMGGYNVTGRILIAPIEGKGRFSAKIDSAEIFVYQKYKESILDDGKVHLTPVKTETYIDVVKPTAQLDGLFNGNAELNAATNKAINDNVDELFEDFKPVVEKALSRIMEDLLLKSIIRNIPWDDLYPVNPKFS